MTVMNHTFIGTWDICLAGAGSKTKTNSLAQFIGDTIYVTNNVNSGPGNTMHGIAAPGGFEIFKNCNFYLTNNISNFGTIACLLPTKYALVNCNFYTYNNGGTVTNIISGNVSGQTVFYFPELYNSTCGTNCWITGDGTGVNSWLNIRTMDGVVTSHQIWP
jgi:hypothetical protein